MKTEIGSPVTVLVVSILVSIVCILGCCGSCLGCQSYRFHIMRQMQATSSNASTGDNTAEGFLRMNDEV